MFWLVDRWMGNLSMDCACARFCDCVNEGPPWMTYSSGGGGERRVWSRVPRLPPLATSYLLEGGREWYVWWMYGLEMGKRCSWGVPTCWRVGGRGVWRYVWSIYGCIRDGEAITWVVGEGCIRFYWVISPSYTHTDTHPYSYLLVCGRYMGILCHLFV